MKILFFSYLSYDNDLYKGGGWVNSLAQILSQTDGFDIGIAYATNNKNLCRRKCNNILYYPIYFEESASQRVLFRFLRKVNEIKNDDEVNIAIADFKPDIIQLFGIETPFGSIVRHISNIPVVVHIQGIMNAILDKWFPMGFSKNELWWSSPIVDKILSRTASDLYCRAMNIAALEKKNYMHYKYYLGRTEWDFRISRILAPNSCYFHCEEMLRSEFYERHWKYCRGRVVISTILNGEIYKGFDSILRCASLLLENGLDFEWNIYGVGADFSLRRIFENKLRLNFSFCKVHFKGKKSALELSDILSTSTFYVHPSHVDNSPNSLCEAMLIGTPCIASYVGGIPSLIEDRVSGFLCADNDPFQIAYIILSTYNNEKYLSSISKVARSIASKRHDKNLIIEQLQTVYHEILNGCD